LHRLTRRFGGIFGNDSHTAWCSGNADQTGFTSVFAPNTLVKYVVGGASFDIDFLTVREGETTSDFSYAAVTSRSHHNGAVHMLLVDGSTRAANNSLDLRVWQALSTRARGELVGQW
jgi:hypothetical protein